MWPCSFARFPFLLVLLGERENVATESTPPHQNLWGFNVGTSSGFCMQAHLANEHLKTMILVLQPCSSLAFCSASIRFSFYSYSYLCPPVGQVRTWAHASGERIIFEWQWGNCRIALSTKDNTECFDGVSSRFPGGWFTRKLKNIIISAQPTWEESGEPHHD